MISADREYLLDGLQNRGVNRFARHRAPVMRASNPFFAAMNAIANPQVGVDINGDVGSMNDDRRAAAMASSIVATYRGTAPG